MKLWELFQRDIRFQVVILALTVGVLWGLGLIGAALS